MGLRPLHTGRQGHRPRCQECHPPALPQPTLELRGQGGRGSSEVTALVGVSAGHGKGREVLTSWSDAFSLGCARGNSPRTGEGRTAQDKASGEVPIGTQSLLSRRALVGLHTGERDPQKPGVRQASGGCDAGSLAAAGVQCGLWTLLGSGGETRE